MTQHRISGGRILPAIVFGLLLIGVGCRPISPGTDAGTKRATASPAATDVAEPTLDPSTLTSAAASAGEPSAPMTLPPAPTATDNPSAGAMQSCQNGSGIYAVTYPGDWYSNGGGPAWDGWDACSLFGPDPFDDAYDPAITIRLLAQPNLGWNDPFTKLTGDFEGYTVLVDEETSIGGRRAWIREFVLSATVAGDHNAGDRQLTYAVDIGAGWFLGADVIAPPDEYPEARAVLERMLDGLEVLVIPEQ